MSTGKLCLLCKQRLATALSSYAVCSPCFDRIRHPEHLGFVHPVADKFEEHERAWDVYDEEVSSGTPDLLDSLSKGLAAVPEVFFANNLFGACR